MELCVDTKAHEPLISPLKKSFCCERLHSTLTSFSTGNKPQCGVGPRFRLFPVSGLVSAEFARSRDERLYQRAVESTFAGNEQIERDYRRYNKHVKE